MMRAAIYARKSTDDNNQSEANKSVTRQIDHARRFAEQHGWTVDEEHIFVDDGISGADYQNREGLNRMMTKTKEFHFLVMSESSRLGRDMTRNAYHIAEITESEVRIFYYLTGEEEKCETPEQKIMVTLKSYASEVERQKASQRARDALKRKAEKGFNTGGAVYGYDNVPKFAVNADGENARTHTEYRINESEADVLRRVFTMYADGHGLTKIAKTLNGDSRYADLSQKYFDGLKPPPPRLGTGSWAPTSVREMLHRERYIGALPFGEHRNIWRKGKLCKVKQNDWMKTKRDDLRIIPHELWERVQVRLKNVAAVYARDNKGALVGQPDTGRHSEYLLSGIARCSVCGGSMIALPNYSGGPGNRKRIAYYTCSRRHNRGETVCTNDHKERIEHVDGPVIAAIESLLTPENMQYIIERAFQRVKEKTSAAANHPRKLEAEIQGLKRQLNNLLNLAASDDPPASIITEIKVREARIAALGAELEACSAPLELAQLEDRRIRRAIAERSQWFKDLLHENIPKARQALRKLLNGPLQFTPVVRDGRKTLDFSGQTKVGLLLDNVRLSLALPRGFEPLFPP